MNILDNLLKKVLLNGNISKQYILDYLKGLEQYIIIHTATNFYHSINLIYEKNKYNFYSTEMVINEFMEKYELCMENTDDLFDDFVNNFALLLFCFHLEIYDVFFLHDKNITDLKDLTKKMIPQNTVFVKTLQILLTL